MLIPFNFAPGLISKYPIYGMEKKYNADRIYGLCSRLLLPKTAPCTGKHFHHIAVR